MKTKAICYLGVLVTMLVLDGLWLGVIAIDFYRAQMGALMAPEFNPVAAVLFYLLYPVGVVFFAAGPAAGQWTHAAKRGAFLGLFAYGTYDLTNWATLNGWTLQLTVVDMAWGTLITTIAAAAGALAVRKLAS